MKKESKMINRLGNVVAIVGFSILIGIVYALITSFILLATIGNFDHSFKIGISGFILMTIFWAIWGFGKSLGWWTKINKFFS